MKTTIKHKIVVPLIALAVVLTASFLGISFSIFRAYVSRTSEAELRSAVSVAHVFSEQMITLSAQSAQRIAYDPVFVAILQEENRGALYSYAKRVQEETSVDFTVVLNARGIVVVRSHMEEYGDDLSHRPIAGKALAGAAVAAFAHGPMIRLCITAGAPVYDKDGSIVGAVITGFRMDENKYVDTLKSLTNMDVSVVMGDTRIATTLTRKDGSRDVGSTIDADVLSAVHDGETFFGPVVVMGQPALASYIPITNGDEQMGLLCVGKYLAPQQKAFLDFVRDSLLAVLLVLVVMIPLCLRVIGRTISPIKQMAFAAERFAGGDLNVTVDVNTHDEVQLLGDAFNRMLEISRQREAFSDILMRLHSVSPDQALRVTLKHVCAYLGLERALLFKDCADQCCELVYEWRSDGESSPPGRERFSYMADFPGLYGALRKSGFLTVSAGRIPPRYRSVLEKQGFVTSAFVKVSLHGEHYGFMWFADTEHNRSWDEDTVRFLRNAAEFVSTVLGQQESARKLLRNQKTYEAVLNNVTSYVFVTEQDTDTILFANKAFTSTFDEQCVGKRAGDYLPCPRDAGSTRGEPGRETGPPQPVELYSERSGEWLAVASTSIVWIDGSTVRLFTCSDITAKKRFADMLKEKIEERTAALTLMQQEAERARQKAEDVARAKANFLANMSYEMRTPMNAIAGMSTISRSTADTEKKEYCIDKIQEASTHLLGVINDILDISQIEAGKMELSSAAFRFRAMIERVAGHIRYTIGRKEQTFLVSVDSGVPDCFVSDTQRIAQVVTNLLSNAVKFTPYGGTITLSARAVPQADDTFLVEIAVNDTGIGISPEGQDRIFQSFSQATPGISGTLGGTGLGLAISKSLARMLGGDISVVSAPGEGSTFTFTFLAREVPCADVGAEREQFPEAGPVADAAEGMFAQYRILLAEDLDINQEILVSLLEPTGIAVDCVANGSEAVRLFSDNPERYDAIFMDINMPEMDGFEATRRIRALDVPRARVIPIIAMTAKAFKEDADKCFDCGMDDHLSKPLDIDSVIGKLQHYLTGRPREDSA